MFNGKIRIYINPNLDPVWNIVMYSLGKKQIIILHYSAEIVRTFPFKLTKITNTADCYFQFHKKSDE